MVHSGLFWGVMKLSSSEMAGSAQMAAALPRCPLGAIPFITKRSHGLAVIAEPGRYGGVLGMCGTQRMLLFHQVVLPGIPAKDQVSNRKLGTAQGSLLQTAHAHLSLALPH